MIKAYVKNRQGRWRYQNGDFEEKVAIPCHEKTATRLCRAAVAVICCNLSFYSVLCVHLLEVLLRPFWIRLHRVRPLVPIRRANIAVLLMVLESLENPKNLLHIAPDRQVVDRAMADHAAGVDEPVRRGQCGSLP